MEPVKYLIGHGGTTTGRVRLPSQPRLLIYTPLGTQLEQRDTYAVICGLRGAPSPTLMPASRDGHAHNIIFSPLSQTDIETIKDARAKRKAKNLEIAVPDDQIVYLDEEIKLCTQPEVCMHRKGMHICDGLLAKYSQVGQIHFLACLGGVKKPVSTPSAEVIKMVTAWRKGELGKVKKEMDRLAAQAPQELETFYGSTTYTAWWLGLKNLPDFMCKYPGDGGNIVYYLWHRSLGSDERDAVQTVPDAIESDGKTFIRIQRGQKLYLRVRDAWVQAAEGNNVTFDKLQKALEPLATKCDKVAFIELLRGNYPKLAEDVMRHMAGAPERYLDQGTTPGAEGDLQKDERAFVDFEDEDTGFIEEYPLLFTAEDNQDLYLSIVGNKLTISDTPAGDSSAYLKLTMDRGSYSVPTLMGTQEEILARPIIFEFLRRDVIERSEQFFRLGLRQKPIQVAAKAEDGTCSVM